MATLLKRALMTAVLTLGLLGAGVGLEGDSPLANADEKKPADKMEKPKADAKPDPKPAESTERTIRGTVLDADGQPVQAELEMVWVEAKTEPLGKTKPDGTFRVTVPVQRKDWGGWLVAKAAGHGPAFYPSGMGDGATVRTPTAEVTLTLPKAQTLTGRLLDPQGKPVVGGTVVATTFSSHPTLAETVAHLKAWATDPHRGFPHVGDRVLYYSDKYDALTNPGGLSPFVATTDKDGRYELGGVGVGQIVTLRARGPGVADAEFAAVNHDGFDPAPINKAAKDARAAMEMTGPGSWVLYKSDATVVMETEKLIRGRLTDHDGKPRAGVKVVFSRTSKRDWNSDYNVAVTDKDGKYEIRGAKKHAGYGVEVRSDPAAGQLPCLAFAEDTVGYEPVTIDLKSDKGVVFTGTVKNKQTGDPIPAHLSVAVLRGNGFVNKYPLFPNGSYSDDVFTNAAGRFRVVTIPGPVVLFARPSKEAEGHFLPATPDLSDPARYTKEFGAVCFYTHGGSVIPVQGNWFQVLEPKATDTEVPLEIEFQPARKTTVKVVDADGKPVGGTKASGLTAVDFYYPSECPTDTLTVYFPDPKKERLLAVVHAERKLVGTLTLTADAKDPVVKLGPGGTVSGRAVDPDGKPLANIWVQLRCHNTTNSHSGLNETLLETDAKGEFRIDGVFPGREFRLVFSNKNRRFGPKWDDLPKYSVAKPGDTLKLGDLKLEPPAKADEK